MVSVSQLIYSYILSLHYTVIWFLHYPLQWKWVCYNHQRKYIDTIVEHVQGSEACWKHAISYKFWGVFSFVYKTLFDINKQLIYINMYISFRLYIQKWNTQFPNYKRCHFQHDVNCPHIAKMSLIKLETWTWSILNILTSSLQTITSTIKINLILTRKLKTLEIGDLLLK